MADWLCAHAVLDTPGHAGTVVGWRTGDGGWDHGYPEIAGYHLAFLAAASAPPASTRAVLGWIARETAAGPPRTRCYRDPARDDDWCNRLVFSFDLAMLLRGLVAARAAAPARADRLIPRIGAVLLAISAGGMLASHLPRGGADPAPPRWSTLVGVHHLKAAAALAHWDDPRAEALAAATVAHWEPLLPQVIARGTMALAHPYLYGIEGLLIRHGRTGEARLAETAGRAFAELLRLFAAHPGGGRGDAGDVAAQILRAGAVLEALGLVSASGWGAARQRCEARLAALTAPEGAICFDARGHRNVWATVFAWQALAMLDGDVPAAPAAIV